MRTQEGYNIPDKMVDLYLDRLPGQFFKILPMKEDEEPTLQEYVDSLRVEMVGLDWLMYALSCDPDYLRLLAILTFLSNEDCAVKAVKREVFKAIGICKRMKSKFHRTEVTQDE